MEYCLKVNTQPSVSENETKLYLKTTDETNFVDQKITYEYEVTNVQTEYGEILIFPAVRWISFDGIIREKKGSKVINTTIENNKFDIMIKNYQDLNGVYNWHGINIEYGFVKHEGVANVLYTKLIDGEYQYAQGHIDYAINEELISSGWTPIAILATTAEECGEDKNGNDRFVALDTLKSNYLTFSEGVIGTTNYSIKNLYTSFSFGSYEYGITGGTALNIPQRGIRYKMSGQSESTDDVLLPTHEVFNSFNGKQYTEVLMNNVPTQNRLDADNDVITPLYYATTNFVYPSDYNIVSARTTQILYSGDTLCGDPTRKFVIDHNGYKIKSKKSYSSSYTGKTYNYSPAAVGCTEYSTLGTNKAQWYLPSVSELYNTLITNNKMLDLSIKELTKSVTLLYEYSDGIARSIKTYNFDGKLGDTHLLMVTYEFVVRTSTEKESQYARNQYITQKLNIKTDEYGTYYYSNSNENMLNISKIGSGAYNSSNYCSDTELMLIVKLGKGIGKKDCGIGTDYRGNPNQTRPFFMGNFRNSKYNKELFGNK